MKTQMLAVAMASLTGCGAGLEGRGETQAANRDEALAPAEPQAVIAQRAEQPTPGILSISAYPSQQVHVVPAYEDRVFHVYSYFVSCGAVYFRLGSYPVARGVFSFTVALPEGQESPMPLVGFIETINQTTCEGARQFSVIDGEARPVPADERTDCEVFTWADQNQ